MEQTQTDKNNVTLVELKSLSETSEKIAREIRMMSRAFKKMSASGLRRETIITLLESDSKVAKRDIRLVLIALERLELYNCLPEVKQ